VFITERCKITAIHGRKDMKERTFQQIETNGIRLRTVVEGKGPLVILLHSFPQCWYLWRHQIDPLVNAGFQVAVPDQRGYGGSDRPLEIEAYDIVHLTNDVVGIADAFGHKQFYLVGHDWGAIVAWYVVLLHRERVKALCNMSVPWPFPPPASWKVGGLTKQENFGDHFWYIVYFQTPDVVEAELEANIWISLRTMYFSFSSDAPEELFFTPKPATATYLEGLINPLSLPAWLTEADLDYYEAQYKRSGFRGPVNWYRNIDRNITLYPQLKDTKIEAPTLFLAGAKDVVLQFEAGWVEQLDSRITDLHSKVFIEGAGHWVQAERPAAVNTALLNFLKTVA
jgi:pimeloyl-ACP methyl ester carboxylesterase